MHENIVEEINQNNADTLKTNYLLKNFFKFKSRQQ